MLKKRNLGMIILITGLALVFNLTGCGDGGGGSGTGNGGSGSGNGNGSGSGSGSGSSGGGMTGTATLNLRGQVWKYTYNYLSNTIYYERFSGNRDVLPAYSWDDYGYPVEIGGSGKITNGQLNYTIGTPSSLANINLFFSGFDEVYSSFNISNNDVRSALIEELEYSENESSYVLYRGYNNTAEDQWEEVLYIYVDRDVNITGIGKTTDITCSCIEYEGICDCNGCDCGYTLITTNLDLNLKSGWNTIHLKSIDSYVDGVRTYTITYSLADPSYMRWILTDWGTTYYSINAFKNQALSIRHGFSLLGSR